jgi:hypothetical protein
MSEQRIPFSPGERRYPPLPADLTRQIARIPSTFDGVVTYCPCAVSLRDGISVDCVYVVEANACIRMWGVWPDQDSGKREVKIQDVVGIQESSFRLPVKLAQVLYDAGESGMGYLVFEIEYRDGFRSAHGCGNAVDFVRLPDGKTMSDVVAVHPHEGRNKQPISVPEYYWCLYGIEN